MQKYISLLLLLTLFSCAIERPSGTTEAEVLFKEAQELMADKRYILATEKLNTLRSQYPYSYYATSAELLQADILFIQENYEEAAAAYILFKDFHPKSNKMDYVMYKIAESYYQQVPPTFDRDLQPAVKAINYYNELRSLFPNSELLKDANEKINLCEKMLVDKEKYIADFYYKTEDYESAKFRYGNILKEISNKELRSHAVLRMLLIGEKLDDSVICRDVYSRYKSDLLEKQSKEANSVYLSCLK
ncbi:outer membrane protein assembly factor BamD [Bacteriovorax sp. Seq25_V]|uniref:outer membrane protein assembly factor BamD n=1 Tax=Bacteriovorax sp. Seq25_V TaxID=1201288 RepID=UPI00038A3DC5|nr:outer membrane protein assembly factor BamD [Bacteriovorax sp. Seq25_V]EQC43547.1 outer membrane assembly lipoprotein YfiO [Bacteriovorax sp. Seq25_V]